jgi:putative membrane protein
LSFAYNLLRIVCRSNREPSIASLLHADVRKAEKVERLRLPFSSLLPVVDRVRTVFQKSRFLGMQLQVELPHSRGEFGVRGAKKAAQGGLAEVKMGQLAEQKGRSQTVKDFGKRMVDDHSKANDELKQAAAKSNITLPEQLDAKDQATYDQLSKLDGSAFDKTYARDMVKDHRADIAEFQLEARTGKDEPTKNLASQTVPTLETHLKMAREMMQSVSGGAGSRSGSSR